MLKEMSAAEAPEIIEMQACDRTLLEYDENFAVTLARFLGRSLSVFEQLHRAVDRTEH